MIGIVPGVSMLINAHHSLLHLADYGEIEAQRGQRILPSSDILIFKLSFLFSL